MKPFALCVAWIACSTGIAQDQTDSRERWACLTSSKCLQTRDARSDAQKLARIAKVGTYWAEGRGNIAVTFAARHIESSGDLFQLRGNVEINTDSLILRADRADYHWDTGEIEPRGNVHVRPIPFRVSRGLSQFGIK
jgi:lipopolysaccharide assembly outer membrane protein LptD (OstA)